MGDLTENFSRSEFTCKDGCGFDSIHPGIVHRLQLCRDVLGEPITVDCGCRCERHNINVGGEANSYHTKGFAVDWTIKDLDKLRRFGIFLENKWSGGWHYYPVKNFIHADIGPRRRW